MKLKHVIYLHGMNASSASFGYLVQKLPEHTAQLLDYRSHQPLEASIQQVIAQLPKTGTICLVGHSLGGVIATIIAADNPDRVEQLVTISSPISGSRAAATLRWLPGSLPVLNDIIPAGAFITRCCELELQVPTLSIISTGGNLPTSPEPNDSVVSLSSQRALRFGKKIEINASHFEVLLHDRTVQSIRNFLFQEQQ